MGYHARVPVESGSLTEADAARLSPVEPIQGRLADKPGVGFAQRNGRTIPFTLETAHVAPDVPHVMMEHLIMAALLAVSFIAPVLHLLG